MSYSLALPQNQPTMNSKKEISSKLEAVLVVVGRI